jgi:hypothetical protein
MTRDLRTLTVTATMSRTGWKRSTIYTLIQSGKLQAIRPLGDRGNFYIVEASLEALFPQDAGAPSVVTGRSGSQAARDAQQRAADEAVLPKDADLAFQ